MNNPQNIRNPYIIGTPIDEPDKFFGRENVFNFVRDNLEQNVQIILLYGQRRIGKSSVLQQIPANIGDDEFVFVHVDCQYQTQTSISEFMLSIATTILETLELENKQIILPSIEDLKTDIEVHFRVFLTRIYPKINYKKLVLLLDEFDVLSEANSQIGNITFFKKINLLLQRDQRLFLIPVVGRNINELTDILLFLKGSPNQEISFLSDDNAKIMIEKPAEGIIRYNQDAIQAILQLSAGHPYFTQLICYSLFHQARENNRWDINQRDVESVVNSAISEGEAGFIWFWEGLPFEQQIIFSAVAESQKTDVQENPVNLLNNNGIILTLSLDEAAQELIKYSFLDTTGSQVNIELVRRWLVQKHPLKEEIKKLENINQEEVKQLLSVADNLCKQNKGNPFEIYKQALELNPNNFTTVISLGQEYLKRENFDEAFESFKRAYQFYSITKRQEIVLEPLMSLAEKYHEAEKFSKALDVYKLAYKIDPKISKEDFLLAREDYGHHLILERKWNQAKEQYQKVLEIDPNQKYSQQKLEEIEVLKTKTTLKTENNNYQPNNTSNLNWLNRKYTVFVGLVVMILVGGFVGVNRFFQPCPAGQQKNLGFFCIADSGRISRGDRTLFPDIKNPNRDLGIQAFKKGDYQQATKLFQNAVNENRNDPEVLIYYNNALALKQGSPITLAVVVPANNERKNAPQEMLRGVAQAQNQFNAKGGEKGRLLEIVIANDDNKTETAKQVAEELVKDKSILGVIGHNSSNVTQAALPEYEQAQLAVISPTSTSILLNSEVFFRTVYYDANAGVKLAKYAFNKLKLNKVVIFGNPNSNYSNSLREVFTNQFEKLGGELVRKPLINLNTSKFDANKEVDESVNRFNAEAVILFPSSQDTTNAVEIIKAVAEKNEALKNNSQNQQVQKLRMLGGDTLYSHKIIKQGDDTINDLIIVVPWFREDRAVQEFAQKSKEQWGGDISWRTATSYDATQAFIKSISLSSNPSRENVLSNLKKIQLSPNETSGYKLQFTEEREREGESILIKFQDGKFTIIPDN